MNQNAHGSLEIIDFWRRDSVENAKTLVDKKMPACGKVWNIELNKWLKTEMHRLVAMHLRFG